MSTLVRNPISKENDVVLALANLRPAENGQQETSILF
jgi:hypothetical protein